MQSGPNGSIDFDQSRDRPELFYLSTNSAARNEIFNSLSSSGFNFRSCNDLSELIMLIEADGRKRPVIITSISNVDQLNSILASIQAEHNLLYVVLQDSPETQSLTLAQLFGRKPDK